MSALAWMMIGLAVATVARLHARAGASHRLVITALFGVTGAFVGGVVAIEVFGMDADQGFFDLVGWTAATAGAVLALVLLDRADRHGRGGRSRKPRPARGRE